MPSATPAVSTRSPQGSARVLFCTTNGVGLGHLTRAMAMARRLPPGVEPVMFTTSQAVPLVREQGFLTEYLPSAGYAGLDRSDWNLLYEHRLGHLIDLYDPQVIVFDGTNPYIGVFTQARRHRERTFVWCRRAMWKPGLGAQSIARASLFDHVLEPGELAASADRGATVAHRAHALRVAPMTLCDESELLPRDRARAALGLADDRVWVLVQLGAGAINDVTSVLGSAFAELQRVDGLGVVVAQSPISSRHTRLPAQVLPLRRFPLAPYLRAFDLTLTAAGYNSYHESLAAAVPSMFVPNADTQMDDQVMRARHAARAGVATCWEDGSPAGFRSALEPLLDAGARARMAGRAQQIVPRNGAGVAASVLAGWATRRRR